MKQVKEGNPVRVARTNLWILTIILLAIILHLAWFAYTHYTEEDAFITFRYARQIANGNGFVYNAGDKIYGTTTPLLTLLLVPWFKIIQNIVPVATAFDLLAAIGAIYFVWQTLRFLEKPFALQILPIVALAVSPKLIGMEMQGMETPLALFFMAASWYTFVRGKTIWTGILLGLLLWTRIDLFLWPFVLCLLELFSNPRRAIQMALIAGCIYVPWLAFATFYFGSPIPFTIIAKWVAYVQNNHAPLTSHLSIVLNYLSPFDLAQGMSYLAPVLALISLGPAVWKAFESFNERTIAILSLFALLEILILVLTRATFFTRYFVPVLLVILILLGLELGTIWEHLESRRNLKIGYIAVLSLALIAALVLGFQRANEYKDKQFYRQDESLKAIGLWLNQNAPVDATVLLEPLGYVGYYSDRTMIDEVGLVTPRIVDLKRQNVDADYYFSIFQPDYYVLHCDDSLRLQGLAGKPNTGFARQYRLIQTYNPLQFDPLDQRSISTNALPRNSCYQIWQRINQ
jgi:hypothetical protein